MATVSVAGFIVSVAVRDCPLKDAVMVVVADEDTVVVLTVKLALVAPAGIVTLLGTVTDGALELDKLTVVGVEPAALIVTVPCEELPPATVVGLRVNDDNTAVFAGGGMTVTTALCCESPKYAVSVTSVGAATELAMKFTYAVFCVEKKIRVERGSGTISGRLLPSMIVAPSLGAFAASVITAWTD